MARFGSDEFVLLCSDLASPRDAVVLSERVQAAVRAPITVGDNELVVTLSIGIAYDELGLSRPEALVRDADAAMYRAKSSGRDRAEVFDDALRHRAMERLDTESGLRRAVDEGRLIVHYQPVIDLRDDRVSGFEALMRWEHPERGLLAPAEFMDVAEETGLIVPLGRHVFAEACRQTMAWQQGPGSDDLGVYVNFSAAQLRHETVVQDVALVIDDTGIDPACVQVEVTEHVLLDDEDVAVSQIAALRDLGVKIVIDDFGTGYSSLAYLRRFPVDLLKVDRSFVAGVNEGNGDAAIVRGVIDLAHRLGLTAVAEGVESVDQVNTLRDLGLRAGPGLPPRPPRRRPHPDRLPGRPGHPRPPRRSPRPPRRRRRLTRPGRPHLLGSSVPTRRRATQTDGNHGGLDLERPFCVPSGVLCTGKPIMAACQCKERSTWAGRPRRVIEAGTPGIVRPARGSGVGSLRLAQPIDACREGGQACPRRPAARPHAPVLASFPSGPTVRGHHGPARNRPGLRPPRRPPGPRSTGTARTPGSAATAATHGGRKRAATLTGVSRPENCRASRT